MADALREQLQVNKLLKADGAPLDAAQLFGRGGKKTRVSVINFSALQELSDQQVFLGQLATMLFSWVKANPATDRPLVGLLVIDEAKDFVPSQKSVPCRQALQRLAAQARKYGLGLVFATQAPKSIDHNIIANCSTQLYGQANSPAAIEVIQDQIKQRGGNPSDVAKLGTGKFYAYSEGMQAPIKVATPLCLSYHPSSPLDEDGVVKRARASKALLKTLLPKESGRTTAR
jgi:DNA helicase HerA-like ATPase